MKGLENALESLSSHLKALSALNQGEPPLEMDTESRDLIEWRNSTLVSLQGLKGAIDSCPNNLTVTERAKIISVAAVFLGQDKFTDEECETRAKACLDNIGALDRSTASNVLTSYMKPLFQASAHPSVHPDTGRVKHNPLSVQNMYDDQPWKTHGAGCWNVLSWVLSNLESDDIEMLWPLIIPPLLTLLDDYKPPYRIRGVNATRTLLDKVSASLLRRTGIDELIFKALRGTLQNLTSEWAPDLLHSAMPCYIALVDLVSPNDDLKRFNKLSELVTDVLVPGWLYASSRIEVMIASVDSLLLVVRALRAGSIRFLKVFIPQLTENMTPREFSPVKPTRDLQIASTNCLLVVMQSARARVPHWRIRILDAVLRCWVDIKENGAQNADSDTEMIRTLLLDIFRELLETSSHLLKSEISTLQDLDAQLFSSLVEEATTKRVTPVT